MPKVSLPPLPLSGLFAVAKPSGPTSMSLVNDLKDILSSSRLFADPAGKAANKGKQGKRKQNTLKIGQGGTLDPLADGVLVVGVGKGTKKLSEFLYCVKEYQTTCLLGCETDSYDSEGGRIRLAPWRHVTRELVESKLAGFRGEIDQVPPIFSALKIQGIPLYEYARKGLPLPRPLEKRRVTVHSLEVVEWKGNSHSFHWPETHVSDTEKAAFEKIMQDANVAPPVEGGPEELTSGEVPTAFVLKMKVSGGTYVRSIVHDLGRVLGSAGHVVSLTRTRQGKFTLNPEEESDDRGCVPWSVFAKASEDAGPVDDEGWSEWERMVMDNMEIVENKTTHSQLTYPQSSSP